MLTGIACENAGPSGLRAAGVAVDLEALVGGAARDAEDGAGAVAVGVQVHVDIPSREGHTGLHRSEGPLVGEVHLVFDGVGGDTLAVLVERYRGGGAGAVSGGSVGHFLELGVLHAGGGGSLDALVVQVR